MAVRIIHRSYQTNEVRVSTRMLCCCCTFKLSRVPMQKVHPDLLSFLRSHSVGTQSGEVRTVGEIGGKLLILFNTPPVECTTRQLLFSRRHHTPQPIGTHFGRREWAVDPTQYAEMTQLILPMPPNQVSEVPEKCLVVLHHLRNNGDRLRVEYRCFPKYSEKRIQLIKAGTGLPLALVQMCESFMWCCICVRHDSAVPPSLWGTISPSTELILPTLTCRRRCRCPHR